MQSKDTAGPPLDQSGLKFATYFVRYRDIYKAAERAKIPKSQAGRLFNKPQVQEEIDRQMEAVRMERARQDVEAETLAAAVLDRELMSLIMLDCDKAGSLKLDAIRLGNVLLKRIRAGNTESLELPPPPTDGDGPGSRAPNFYHVLVQQQAAAPLMPEEQPAQPSAVSGQPSVTEPDKEPDKNPITTPAASGAPAPGPRRVGGIKIG